MSSEHTAASPQAAFMLLCNILVEVCLPQFSHVTAGSDIYTQTFMLLSMAVLVAEPVCTAMEPAA